MVDVARLSVVVDTTDLKRAEAALESLSKDGRLASASIDELERSAKRAGAASDRMGQSVRRGSRRLSAATSTNRNFGRSIQNSAFQIGDFAVQVGSGQRASIALAQQLPQLLGGFGILGAVLGAVVAIAVPLVTAMRGLADEGKDVTAVFGELQPVMKSIQSGMAALADFALAAANVLVNNIDRILVIAGTAAAFFAGRWVASFVAARVASFSLATSLVALRGALIRTGFGALIVGAGELVFQFMRLTRAAGGFGEAVGLLGQFGREVFNNIGLVLDVLVAKFRVGALSFQRFFLASFANVLQAFQDLTWDVAQGLNNLFGTNLQGVVIDAISGIGTGPIDQMIAGLDRSIADAMGAGNTASEQLMAALPALQQMRDLMASMKDENITLDSIFGGGSEEDEDGEGGSASRLRERLSKQEQAIRDHMERIKAISSGSLGEQLDGWDGYFSNLYSLTQSKNEKLLKVAKAFGAASALINAWEAHNEVLKDPTLPWYARIASAASVLAAGIGAVNAIKNVSAGGGGAGASSGATAAPATANVNTSPRVALTLVGDDNATFSKSQVRDLINQINEATEDGAIVRLA